MERTHSLGYSSQGWWVLLVPMGAIGEAKAVSEEFSGIMLKCFTNIHLCLPLW